VESGALLATDQTTKLIKSETDRVRPDGSDDKSLPSGHASGAFAGARLANRNLDAIEMKPWLRRTLQGGNFALAGAAAWARVEGEKHYPTDVLVGAALGNFISTFIHDAFMNLPADAPMPLRIEPSTRGVMVSWTWTF
jgi:membrane-associated phospholipid phosphatase